MRCAFEKRRNYLVERMNQIAGVRCLRPQGAFYVMMDLKQILGATIQGVRTVSYTHLTLPTIA